MLDLCIYVLIIVCTDTALALSLRNSLHIQTSDISNTKILYDVSERQRRLQYLPPKDDFKKGSSSMLEHFNPQSTTPISQDPTEAASRQTSLNIQKSDRSDTKKLDDISNREQTLQYLLPSDNLDSNPSYKREKICNPPPKTSLSQDPIEASCREISLNIQTSDMPDSKKLYDISEREQTLQYLPPRDDVDSNPSSKFEQFSNPQSSTPLFPDPTEASSRKTSLNIQRSDMSDTKKLYDISEREQTLQYLPPRDDVDSNPSSQFEQFSNPQSSTPLSPDPTKAASRKTSLNIQTSDMSNINKIYGISEREQTLQYLPPRVGIDSHPMSKFEELSNPQSSISIHRNPKVDSSRRNSLHIQTSGTSDTKRNHNIFERTRGLQYLYSKDDCNKSPSSNQQTGPALYRDHTVDLPRQNSLDIQTSGTSDTKRLHNISEQMRRLQYLYPNDDLNSNPSSKLEEFANPRPRQNALDIQTSDTSDTKKVKDVSERICGVQYLYPKIDLSSNSSKLEEFSNPQSSTSLCQDPRVGSSRRNSLHIQTSSTSDTKKIDNISTVRKHENDPNSNPLSLKTSAALSHNYSLDESQSSGNSLQRQPSKLRLLVSPLDNSSPNINLSPKAPNISEPGFEFQSSASISQNHPHYKHQPFTSYEPPQLFTNYLTANTLNIILHLPPRVYSNSYSPYIPELFSNLQSQNYLPTDSQSSHQVRSFEGNKYFPPSSYVSQSSVQQPSTLESYKNYPPQLPQNYFDIHSLNEWTQSQNIAAARKKSIADNSNTGPKIQFIY